MGFIGDQVQSVRRFIPARALPGLARKRIDKLYEDEDFRSSQRAEMEFTLEHTERAAEIGEITRGYSEFALLRGYRRWHPRMLCHQPVAGIEWLTTKRDPDRGVVISFLHHAQYDGVFPSLARLGTRTHAVVAPEAFDPACPIQLRQHFKVASSHPQSSLVSTGIGSAGLAEMLTQGEILAIASDVAGRTPVTFLGREVHLASGAPRLAMQTNSPVVLVTSHQTADGTPSIQVHEPIEPGGYTDPAVLLTEIMHRHEPAIIAWPEAFDSPYGRLVGAAVV
jgi:lauroyl/myristoyl acyltransferase